MCIYKNVFMTATEMELEEIIVIMKAMSIEKELSLDIVEIENKIIALKGSHNA